MTNEILLLVQAGRLQKLVAAKKDKNKYYKEITGEARSIQISSRLKSLVPGGRSTSSRSKQKSASSWQRLLSVQARKAAKPPTRPLKGMKLPRRQRQRIRPAS